MKANVTKPMSTLQRHTTCRHALFVAWAVLLSVLPASAEVPEGERAAVTDPATLQGMGFPPDAKNVYIAKALLNAQPRPAEAAPDATESFGSLRGFTPLGAKAFIGRQNTAGLPFQWNGGGESCCTNMSRTGGEPFADGDLQLPSGVSVDVVRLWANDIDAVTNLTVALLESCHPDPGGGPTSTTQVGLGGTTGSSGYQSAALSLVTFTVDNRRCQYTVRVLFPTATNTLTLQKVRVEWSRQVSPAPATATFPTDVPTTHPFFRFVEALAAAGITGGCGTGTYCPDSAVTRGQMAVFLATALGLAFQ